MEVKKKKSPLLRLIREHKINATHICRVANADGLDVDHGYFKQQTLKGELTPEYEEAIRKAIISYIQSIVVDLKTLEILKDKQRGEYLHEAALSLRDAFHES